MSGASFTAPISRNLSANATDPEKNLARVEFYNGATKLGEGSTTPYSFAWNNIPVGSYSLTAPPLTQTPLSSTSPSTQPPR